MALIPACETLVLCWRHEEPSRGVDLVWDALLARFGLNPTQAIRYTRGSDKFLARLQAHKLVQEDRDRYWRLHPLLENYQGEYRFGQYLMASSTCVFRSELRLNTDGPSMPVLELMYQLVSEVRPKKVIAVSLGASTDSAHEGEDVILSGKARFALRGEISGTDLNNRGFGSAWAPPAELLALTFPQQNAPPELKPPSLHYVPANPLPRPQPYTPRCIAAAHPIHTSPMLTEHQFQVPLPGAIVGEASAVDMDCVSVAQACDLLGVPCRLVIGIAVPPIARLSEDSESSIRRAWIDEFRNCFAPGASRNAADVAYRLVSI